MNSRQFGQIKNIVEAVSGDLINKRVRVVGPTGDGVTIAANGITSQTLLVCDTDGNPNEDLATDGTNIAEVNYGSRLLGIDLNVYYKYPASNQIMECMIYKDIDSLIGASADPAELFNQDVNSTNILIRKTCLAYWNSVSGTSSKDLYGARVRISHSALARNRKLAAGDKLYIVFKNMHATLGGKYWITGKIIVSEN